MALRVPSPLTHRPLWCETRRADQCPRFEGTAPTKRSVGVLFRRRLTRRTGRLLGEQPGTVPLDAPHALPLLTLALPVIADQFDVFLLDLDGVLYLSDEPIPGAIDAVQRLLARGKTIRVLTNNPRLSRTVLQQRFARAELSLPVAAIVTAGWAAARFLSQHGITQADVVGSAGAQEALPAEGISLTRTAPEAVVVGADRSTTYLDLQRAMDHIRQGVQFVGTNPDTSFPTPTGRGLGAGAILQALQAATGVAPTIAGKPEPLIFEMACADLPPDARVVMVGDNPDTDIRGARRAGLSSMLIGDNATPGDFAPERRPDVVHQSLTGVFENPSRSA